MTQSRKIIVDGQEYRWQHTSNYQLGNSVNVWIEGHRRAILRVRFERPSPRHPDFLDGFDDSYGHPDGFVNCGVRAYNLNRPAMAAGLIREARARGWDPFGRRPLTPDGFALLRERATALPHEPIHDPWIELAAQLLERRAAADQRPPLAWLRERTGSSWPLRNLHPQLVALAFAGLLELGILFERHDALTPAQLAEAHVWADARQSRAEPGGLALATWLAHGSIVDERELDDLRRWCETLLSAPRNSSAPSTAE